jgi:hypothetical protein
MHDYEEKKWKKNQFFSSPFSTARDKGARMTDVDFFPESERTGPPVGGRPHSTGPEGGRARGDR